jgi:sugar phosphate isomerase/epimerase
MKIATAPVNWNNNDVRDYRPWTPHPQLSDEVPEVIQTLKRHGYTGWLVIEQNTTADDPTQNAARNRQYLETILRKAGAHE